MKSFQSTLGFFLLAATLITILRCDEAPLIESRTDNRLNSPSSMVLVPGTDLAIVANANVNLDQVSGSLIAVDLVTNELLTDTLYEIPNFAGDMFLDTFRKRIYIPDRDEALLVYDYQIPGDGGKAISFSKHDVPSPIDNDRHFISNGIETDDIPTQALMVPGTSLGDLILTTNQKGTVSMIPASTLKHEDLDEDEDYFGLRLFSSSNFVNLDKFPGAGASRMGISPVSGLVYVTSILNNQVYAIDPVHQTIEAMIDLDSFAFPTIGMREIAIDSNDRAYIAHSGLDSILIVDLSGVRKNGIEYEVVIPPLIGVIPVGDGPEDIEINASGTQIFVTNQNEDSVYLIDTTLQQITNRVYLNVGKSPGRLVLDESRNTLYSLDFFSNTISRFDATTGNYIGDIE